VPDQRRSAANGQGVGRRHVERCIRPIASLELAAPERTGERVLESCHRGGTLYARYLIGMNSHVPESACRPG